MVKKRKKKKKKKNNRFSQQNQTYTKFSSPKEIPIIIQHTQKLPLCQAYVSSSLINWKKIPLSSPILLTFYFSQNSQNPITILTQLNFLKEKPNETPQISLSYNDIIIPFPTQFLIPDLLELNISHFAIKKCKFIVEYNPKYRIPIASIINISVYIKENKLKRLNEYQHKEKKMKIMKNILSDFHNCLFSQDCLIKRMENVNEMVRITVLDKSKAKYFKMNYITTKVNKIEFIVVKEKVVEKRKREEDSILLVETDLSKKIEMILKIRKERGIIVHGMSGVGKSYTIENIVKRKKIEFVKVLGSEKNTFEKILKKIKKNNKLVVIMDDFDILCGDINFVNSLCHFFDEVKNVLVVAITSNITKIPKTLQRNGRLSKEIHVHPPNSMERKLALKQLLKDIIIDAKEHENIMNLLVKSSNGFLISDLLSFVREIMVYKFNIKKDILCIDDFKNIVKVNSIKPSIEKGELNMINVIEDISELKWSDIGGLDDVKLKLRQCIEWPVIYKDKMSKLGIVQSRGVLLYGPPGCGKTSLVKALAHTIKFSFLYLSSASVYSPYVGESERILREIFKKARESSPSIIFLDEIDSIVGKRDFSLDSSGGGGSGIEQRILSTLLNEMDGIESKKNVIIVAATNRPDMIDKALMRPGRLDYILYVPPPSEKARYELLKIYLRDRPYDSSLNFESIVKNTNGYSGADMESLCREATLFAIKRNINNPFIVNTDFTNALNVIESSITQKMIEQYKNFQKT